MKNKSSNLIWLDLEMTGLDVEKEVIIEIATMITDSALNLVALGPNLVIKQPDSRLDNMDAWNTKHHTQSGLIEKVKASKLSLEEAERKTLVFLQQYVNPNSSPMCGNSVHQDRRFLAKYMPSLEKFFHYRNLDISTLKELATRWYPKLEKFKKHEKHQALEDIKESLAELKFYKEQIFK